MRSLMVAVLVGAFCVPAPASADQSHAEADKLFEEAQALKQAGKGAEACKKYDEALQKNRNAVGTLLNVAKCSEQSGKLATAVQLYSQARDLAREHDLNEHRAAAEEGLRQIGDRVPRLAIAFTERPDSMKLVIDDEIYPTDAESTNEVRLDPGTRHIVVTAPGRLPYSVNVELVEGKQQAVAIPPLGHPVTVKRVRRTVGKILTFSGAGLAISGVVMGYFANQKYEAQFKVMDGEDAARCSRSSAGATPLCDLTGSKETSAALQLGTFGTVVGVAGAVALGVGVALWLTAPPEVTQQRVSILPSVTHDSAGITAVGRF
jgi:hypothetical protein